MDENISIDVSDLLYMPLRTLEHVVFKLDASAPGTAFVLSVIRYVAVLAICGMAAPKDICTPASVQRGVEMLEILRAYAQNQPIGKYAGDD